ncbi:putative LysR family transcriptional regulator [Rhodovulum sp. PH10]|uniref:LysR family transcriptional regulator n=1 Tax=Rhodovulum sp. PH10 TaxID=1187851 RepID=UPI00027C23DC|nr:LysR family transcriptional regulator [Rhodovulum sp. PH10]EJW10304.1 putative LysR family transcriptional regulator [Rhodovulum sp. PH10]
MLDTRLLQAFYWVATLGGFNKAAARLAITQPAVSQRVAQLEADLGVTLIERSPRHVCCTEKGLELLSYVERILSLNDAMHHAVAVPDAVHGVFRLGVVETIVHTWLQEFMRALDVLYPNLALEIDAGASPQLEDKLRADEIDLGFLLLPQTDPDFEVRELCKFPMGLVASPRLRLGGRRVPLARVAAHPVMTFARRGDIHLAVSHAFADVRDLRLHASTTLAPIVRMAIDGLAVACVPPAAVRREIADGELEIVHTDAALADVRFAACWRRTPERRLLERVVALAVRIAAGAARPDAGAGTARAQTKPRRRRPTTVGGAGRGGAR